MLKAFLPKQLRLAIRLLMNMLYDIRNGYLFAYARKRNVSWTFTDQLSITQNLHPNDAKKQNLLLAKNAIEAITIMPNEIFSFWKALGAPTRKNGFQESRSIIGNKIAKSVGGGLCQLSGMIYYISLKADLEIIERHPHSIDIYDEETRFAPLGSDATIVYGYKDLKIRNNSGFPIRFAFIIEKENLSIQLYSSGQIEEKEICFKTRYIGKNKVEVKTIKDGELVEKSVYKKPLSDNEI